jgi:hypothetical protein
MPETFQKGFVANSKTLKGLETDTLYKQITNPVGNIFFYSAVAK